VVSTAREYKNTGAGDTSPAILSWLTWGERWRDAGHRFFAAIQRDTYHDDAMEGLGEIVRSVGGTVWEFRIDEGLSEINNSARLAGITMGRNLAHEFAQRDPSITHLLFVDSDVTPPADAVERLLEVYERFPEHSLVGGDITIYGLHGEAVKGAPKAWNLQEHWVSAGLLMMRRDAFTKLRWRWDLMSGITDDPLMAMDAEAMGFGTTLCRHSVVGQHFPANRLPAFDQRGHDLSLSKEV